jgi:hypothetical protein
MNSCLFKVQCARGWLRGCVRMGSDAGSSFSRPRENRIKKSSIEGSMPPEPRRIASSSTYSSSSFSANGRPGSSCGYRSSDEHELCHWKIIAHVCDRDLWVRP